MDGVSLNELLELLRTEESYVDDLKKVVEHFLQPMRTLGMLSKEDEHAIFSNVETLQGIHEELLRQLHSTPAGKTPAGVAAVFEKMSPFLHAYSSYCGDFVGAQPQLERLRERSGGTGSALEACLRDGERRAGQPLSSLLIKPVQRLCKYPLLFREPTGRPGAAIAPRRGGGGRARGAGRQREGAPAGRHGGAQPARREPGRVRR